MIVPLDDILAIDKRKINRWGGGKEIEAEENEEGKKKCGEEATICVVSQYWMKALISLLSIQISYLVRMKVIADNI